MGKTIKHTDLSAEGPGLRAFVDVRLKVAESWLLAADPASRTGSGWPDVRAWEPGGEDPGPQGTLGKSERLWLGAWRVLDVDRAAAGHDELRVCVELQRPVNRIRLRVAGQTDN